FAKEYKKLFPDITSEEICKAFQVNNEPQAKCILTVENIEKAIKPYIRDLPRELPDNIPNNVSDISTYL
ncbi:15150_t:CDS:2, partial [Funneliformis caledonium]